MAFEEISFGSVLKDLRIKKTKLTQKQMADKLRVGLRTYVKWETGESLPKDRYLIRIKECFDLNEEDTKKLYRTKAQEPPLLVELPFPQNPLFTGRNTYLQRLEQLLQENGTVTTNQPVSITGLGGIGKTQLALEYAHRHYQKKYQAVFWVSAAKKETLEDDYVRLAHRLKLLERNEQEIDRNHIVVVVKQWFEEHNGWLLILDNVENLELASSFLPTIRRGHILLTTRLQAVGNIATPIEIEKMEPDEGLHFLLKRSRILREADKLDAIDFGTRMTARELVKLLGAHPLALDQAGAYLEETRIAIADYINLYRKERHFLLRRRGSLGSGHPETVVTTLELSLKQACEQHPLTADILHFCSFLNPHAMPEILIYRADGLKFDTLSFNEATAALQRYSLLKRTAREKLLSMHPLVQEVLIAMLPPNLKKQWFLCAQRTLSQADKENLLGEKSFLEKLQYSYKNNMKLEPEKPGYSLYSHASRAVSHAEGMKGLESDAATLFLRGEPVFSLQERKQSKLKYRETKLQEKITFNEKHYGAEHPEIIVDLRILAEFYVEQGKYGRAKALYERVEGICDLHPEAIDIHTINMFVEWAKIARTQEKHERTIILYERALQALKQLIGPDPYAWAVKKSYATFLRSIGRNTEAVAIEADQEKDLEGNGASKLQTWDGLSLIFFTEDFDDGTAMLSGEG